MKQYIIIRNDKKIPIGKIIAHVAHNAIINWYENMSYEDPGDRHYHWYYGEYQTKVVVSASLKLIKSIIERLEAEDIPVSMINDVKYKYPICAVISPVSVEESIRLGLADLPLYKG